MNDRDTIEKIEELIHESMPLVKAPDYVETGAYLVRQPDGGYVMRYATRRRRVAVLHDTSSLARLIEDELAQGNSTEVFFSSEGVTALVVERYDEHTVQGRHTLPLPRHPSFARVTKLADTETFDQKSLIRFLRAELNGHVDDSVIERFRSLKLKTDGEGSSVIAQGREAVDRRIQQKISDEKGEQIPTEIEVTIPVYDLDEARDTLYEVGILVDVTPGDNGQPVFELTTILNDLRGAERSALDQLVETLTEALPDGVPLYYGSV